MKQFRVRVKMCGMTRSDDIAQAAYLGVDAIGLIFYPQSARYVSVEQAKVLLKDLPPFVDAVAVLVNPEPGFVQKIIDELPIQLLQFHGDESPEFCQQFSKAYIKTLHPTSEAQIQDDARNFSSAKALLLDTPSQHSRGGTGQVFNWELIPKQMDRSYVLAGGLNELNVLDALNKCCPYALDLCSGIETAPGVKDHDKMSRFMNLVSKAGIV